MLILLQITVTKVMTNIKVVEDEFVLPYKPHDYQYDTVERAAEHQCVLLTDKIGLGKSVMSLYLGLYHAVADDVEQIMILVPPALLDQTAELYNSVKGIDSILIYRGTPTERKKLDIENSPVFLMSYNIFRSDFNRIQRIADRRKLFILADELSLKTIGATYKKIKLLLYRKLRLSGTESARHYLCGCNATPLSDREQIYNWCSIFNPGLYPSHRLFELAHVAKLDYWGKVEEWREIELMDENFNSFCVESRNVDIELPETVFTEIPYQLSKKHKDLYTDIAEAEFKLLPDNLQETAVEAYFSTLQKVVLVPNKFGLNIRPPILDIIDTYLDQLSDDDSIILYTRHVDVSEMLSEYYKKICVSYFGTVSKKAKTEGLLRFKQGDAQMMVANLDSLGKGQNLQVANHTIYVEYPFRSDIATQAGGRTARQGQKKTCFFQFPLAKGTIHEHIYKRLLDNDVDLLKFNRNKQSLREVLKG